MGYSVKRFCISTFKIKLTKIDGKLKRTFKLLWFKSNSNWSLFEKKQRKYSPAACLGHAFDHDNLISEKDGALLTIENAQVQIAEKYYNFTFSQ